MPVVRVPIGKAALPARPFRPPEPSASVGSPAAASAHPYDREVKTPEASDAEISPSSKSEPPLEGVWRTEDRSRSPVGRVVNPTGSVAGYLPARPVGPPPQQVRPPLARTPQQAREFPHSFIRIARAPATHRH